MNQYIRDFLILEQIGKGASGQVFRVSDKNNNNIYSLKIQGYCSPEEKECIKYFSGLKFHNIVNHYENFDHKNGLQQLNCTVMDYCNSGDLFNYLNKNRHLLQQNHKQEIIFQIGFGLWEMSQLNIIHRDIKPQNIMVHNVQNQFRFQICDLGLSKLKETASTLNIGTPYYMAPELIDENKANGTYDSSVDIWAFGGLIYDLYAPSPLFNGNSLKEIFDCVKKRKIDINFQQNVKDENIRQLITDMIQIEPEKRLKIENILTFLDEQRFEQQKLQFKKNNEIWFSQKTQSQIINSTANFNKLNKTVFPPQQLIQVLQPQKQGTIQVEKQGTIQFEKQVMIQIEKQGTIQVEKQGMIQIEKQETQNRQTLNQYQPINETQDLNQFLQINNEVQKPELQQNFNPTVEQNNEPQQLQQDHQVIQDQNFQPMTDLFVVNRARLRFLLKDENLISEICQQINQKYTKDQIKIKISDYLDELIKDLKFE